jgi:hypothetical protein
MTDIEERFGCNGDHRSLITRQLLGRASVKRKSSRRPTQNRVANLVSLRFSLVLQQQRFPVYRQSYLEVQYVGHRLFELLQQLCGP